MKKGFVEGISGNIVYCNRRDVSIGERAFVGENALSGEVVKILKDGCLIIVYEDTRGLKLYDDIYFTDKPTMITLGPGLLSGIFDGLQRPLDLLNENSVKFLIPTIKPIDFKSKNSFFEFIPEKKAGESVEVGERVGYVIEKGFKVSIFSEINGVIDEIKEGRVNVESEIAITNDGKKIYLHHQWPLKKRRIYKNKCKLEKILLTGQRIIDFLFPIPLGGTVIVPGGFGTGKTILQQTIAKFAKIDIVIYVGCGERGNEMAELLEEFEKIKDPWNDKTLMDRTVIIVNTSNMPVAAREASIYTGITTAEYYRDSGLNVLLIVDSISRWAEALREISSSLEEMPGDEGYPTYLTSRLAGFFERAGVVETLNKEIGSITLLVSVSPPGGDITEPVTQSCLRNTGALLMLDKELANRRFFPAINYKTSYSLYEKDLKKSLIENFGENYFNLKEFVVSILKEEEKLKEILDIIGYESLQDSDRLIIDTAELIKTKFLSQNAFTKDAFSTPEEMIRKIENIKQKHEKARNIISEGNNYDEVIKIYETL